MDKLIIFLLLFNVVIGEDQVHIPIESVEVSSFDETPDWAPWPDSMAAADQDLLTRWSSSNSDREPWILLDLGKSRTINQIILRWESAFAKKFKLSLSEEISGWDQVFAESFGQGGTTSIYLSDRKGRYLKLLASEMANPHWGISLWEIELFGPASKNPDLDLSKEEYYNQLRQNEIQREQKFKELAAPVPSLEKAPFQKGVNLTSYSANDLFLKTC